MNIPLVRMPLISITPLTPDVKSFRVARPDTYAFVPGQAVMLAIDLPEWRGKLRPFTFANSPDKPFLEFIIKEYPDHHGVTEKLHSLSVKDSLLVGTPFGGFNYRGSGVFLAGGVGIAPFMSIFRTYGDAPDFEGSSLIFSNKTKSDIILEDELRRVFPEEKLHLTLSREEVPGYLHGRITRGLLESVLAPADLERPFYVCGSPAFVSSMGAILEELGVDRELVHF